jgi:hypothetical protein
LKKKAIESEIAQVATINFHRIIQVAEISEVPASPKPVFLIAMALFITLVCSTLICYVVDFIRGVVKGVYDLRSLHLVGVFSKEKASDNSTNIAYMYSQMFSNNQTAKVYGFVPCFDEEGIMDVVSDITYHLGKEGMQVAIIQREAERSLGHLSTEEENNSVSCFTYSKKDLVSVSIKQSLEGFGGVCFADFDYVFIVTGGAIVEPHIQVLAPYLGKVILASEHGKTKKKHLNTAIELVKSNTVTADNQGVLLLGAPEFLNYDGSFIGIKYIPNRNVGLIKRVLASYNNYMNSWWV